MSKKPTPLSEILEHFEGSAFSDRVDKAIADTALMTVAQDGKKSKGEVTLTLKFQRIAESSQVHVVAEVAYDAPTSKGRKAESYATETPLHVVSGGALTGFPEASPMFKGADAARKD